MSTESKTCPKEKTLFERTKESLLNKPIVAYLAIAFIAISAVASLLSPFAGDSRQGVSKTTHISVSAGNNLSANTVITTTITDNSIMVGNNSIVVSGNATVYKSDGKIRVIADSAAQDLQKAAKGLEAAIEKKNEEIRSKSKNQ